MVGNENKTSTAYFLVIFGNITKDNFRQNKTKLLALRIFLSILITNRINDFITIEYRNSKQSYSY